MHVGQGLWELQNFFWPYLQNGRGETEWGMLIMSVMGRGKTVYGECEGNGKDLGSLDLAVRLINMENQTDSRSLKSFKYS